MRKLLTVKSEELPISVLRKRQLSAFDFLERDGDYKILMPSTRSFLPSFTVEEHGGASGGKTQEGYEYTFPEVAITRLSNAIVGETGAVFINGSPISETLEGLLEENVPTLVEDIIEEKDVVVSASRYGNFNHAVFSCETMPLLYIANMDQSTIGLPRMLSFDRRFCTEKYELDHRSLIARLGLETTDGQWVNKAVSAETVLVPSISRRKGASRASLLTRYLSQLARSTAIDIQSLERSKLIYISRRFANSRVPSNIDDIESMVANCGFSIIYLESLSCIEQINLFQSAKFILAEHGAGLINLMYCAPGARVMEMFPNKMFGHWTFRLLSYVSGVRYYGAVFPVSEPWKFNQDPVTIDLEFLRRCIDRVLNK